MNAYYGGVANTLEMTIFFVSEPRTMMMRHLLSAKYIAKWKGEKQTSFHPNLLGAETSQTDIANNAKKGIATLNHSCA